MRLARITGTVIATAKDDRLTGQKLLLLDLVDSAGKVLAPAEVAVDTVGAGVGDTVIVTTGSAARMAGALSGLPVDITIIAIVDRISVS